MAQSSVIRGFTLIAVVLQFLALTTSSPQTAYNSPKNFRTFCPEGSRRFIAILARDYSRLPGTRHLDHF
jgi:hypothetical protein